MRLAPQSAIQQRLTCGVAMRFCGAVSTSALDWECTIISFCIVLVAAHDMGP